MANPYVKSMTSVLGDGNFDNILNKLSNTTFPNCILCRGFMPSANNDVFVPINACAPVLNRNVSIKSQTNSGRHEVMMLYVGS